jgi:predicted nucleic acid-binding protein
MAGKACVLDSSIAIKWFVDESDSKEAVELLKRLNEKKVTIIVPDLILYEIANSLRWNPKFNQEDIEEALRDIAGFGLQINAPTFVLLKNAISLAYTTECTVYDAVFLALAKNHECALVTADQKLARVKGVLTLKEALGEF